jgi:spermidine synthase
MLMIGGAGGTLATMLTRRGIRVTLVDINPMAFDIARLYFHMPAEVDCQVGDGAAFLRRNKGRYDAIVLDAFHEEKIPRHFLKTAFFRLVRMRLKPGGMFLINITVLDDEDPVPDGICWALKRVWRKVRLLDSDGFENRNAIAMAGAVEGLKRPGLRMKPKTGARTLRKELSQLAFRPLR